MAPLITVFGSLLGAFSFLAMVNGMQAGSTGMTILGSVGFVLYLAVQLLLLLPPRFNDGAGRYEASVYIKTMGHPRPLWSSRYRFAWHARLDAVRMKFRLMKTASFSDEQSLRGLVWNVRSINGKQAVTVHGAGTDWTRNQVTPQNRKAGQTCLATADEDRSYAPSL